MDEIFTFWNEKLPYGDTKNALIILGVYALVICFAVIIIGYVVNWIEQGQLTVLSKVFGHSVAFFLTNILTFPGVMIHELSHALFALITGAKVKEVHLFEPQPDGTLGWVVYAPRGNFITKAIQNALSSCAPTLVGIAVEIGFVFLWQHGILSGIWLKVLAVYLMISMADHMSMSGADIKNYLHGIIPVAILVYAVLCLVHFL